MMMRFVEMLCAPYHADAERRDMEYAKDADAAAVEVSISRRRVILLMRRLICRYAIFAMLRASLIAG